ncbi:DUF2589 domain-containing protein [Pseudomonas sp. S75]|uniref:DUF2589 domain-containing protein n=1 Tax=unclassified Pseudomonas TaxID=196821 RepID=UPI00190341CE|nr:MULTISPECIES: DUF2589 domain-containing protein [unclassified Pseudomonas]MBJ9973865.1 DUF2589 domain-containing protein [Pseudomonas sp. S30]MBK0152205.1 DUF2589 domain-containing protein [Pseudomonas sp. S75]
MISSDLRDITRGLQEAAAATNTLIAQQYVRLFDQFFDVDQEQPGLPMRAKMVEVAMDDAHTLRIPLIALVAPRGLALERMQVDLSVHVKDAEAREQALGQSDPSTSCAHFKVTVGAQSRRGEGRDPDEVQIRMQFQACEAPEAINRLIEEYTNLIQPVRQPRPLDPTPHDNEFIAAATVR